MNDKQLSSLLVLIVPQIIKEIMENDSVTEEAATLSFYNSKLYSLLEDDNTKLWHLSPKQLYVLYEQEIQNGEIEFPEEA